MGRFKLAELANVAEIVASVVIVVSLVYVGMELSQNTKAVHAASYQALIANLTEVDLAVVTNPHLDRIITTGEMTPTELSKEEWSTFSRYSLARTGQMELAYLSYRDGALSQLQWSGVDPFIAAVLCLPGYQRFWEENRASVFSPSFVDYVEDNVIPSCRSPSQ